MNAEPLTRRRDFLKAGGLLAGGLVIGFTVAPAKRAQAQGEPSKLPAPNAFLRIGADGSVLVLLAHVEMGQGVWTTLPMLIAEELDADWSMVRAEHAPAAPAYLHTAFGIQITGGSTSTHSEFDRYRQVGAMARALLVEAAAKQLGVKPEECRTENGFVISGDKKVAYGELAEAAAKLPLPDKVQLKKPEDWKIIGKGKKRLDSPEKVNGIAKFGIDVQVPGMLVAVVERAPSFGGAVKAFDAGAAKAVPGVREVVQIPGGVAVLADHFWAAKLGREALKVDWEPGPHAGLDSTKLREELARLAGTDGAVANQAGDAAAGLGKGAKTVEAEYFLPYLAHCPMEPLNCTVRITPQKCEIWTGTQLQTVDQQNAARITGLKPEQVEIHTTFLGGGFGRRATATSDFISEAVETAKASGKTVKVMWTREDDVRGGYYRPAFLHRAKIALDGEGWPKAWQHVLAGQSIAAGTPFEPMMIKDGVDATSVEGVADSPYLAEVPDRRVELHSPKTGIPVLWWRSVGHSHTGFVMESLLDELAHAAGKDPAAYRRALLKEHPRHLAALDLAVEKAGWDTPPKEGISRGVAVHESFGSFVAQVAEVSVSKEGQLKVHRVVCAINCGLAVNPDGVKAQMESGIVFALSAVLYGKITFADGRVQQGNFHDYQVLRMHETPLVETYIVPSTAKMGGAGECGVPPLAPAVCNAIFAATGKRIRELPLRPEDLKHA